uniref:Uncharacterized protein n=1 Tax=Knipowitschia caucasica TaxID=637954 RepID=A0AAV2KHW9_KNICA
MAGSEAQRPGLRKTGGGGGEETRSVNESRAGHEWHRPMLHGQTQTLTLVASALVCSECRREAEGCLIPYQARPGGACSPKLDWCTVHILGF